MPGASRVLANTGTALCACQDRGSKQAHPFECSLSFHVEGQHSPVSGIVEWKKTVEHFVLNPYWVVYKRQAHMHKHTNKHTGRSLRNCVGLSGLPLLVSSHADSFLFLDLKILRFLPSSWYKGGILFVVHTALKNDTEVSSRQHELFHMYFLFTARQ